MTDIYGGFQRCTNDGVSIEAKERGRVDIYRDPPVRSLFFDADITECFNEYRKRDTFKNISLRYDILC